MSLSRVLGRHRPQGRTEETALHPTISYCLAQARAADLRGQAQRAILARAARRAGVGDAHPAAAARQREHVRGGPPLRKVVTTTPQERPDPT